MRAHKLQEKDTQHSLWNVKHIRCDYRDFLGLCYGNRLWDPSDRKPTKTVLSNDSGEEVPNNYYIYMIGDEGKR